MKINSIFIRILTRFGKFEKGVSIRKVSREEYEYRRPVGYSVLVYVFWVSGKQRDIDRVLVKSTLARWSEPDKTEPISQEEQAEIISKFRRYFSSYGEIMDVE